MANIVRVRVEWQGLTGLPGISTFYCGTTDADISELTALYTAVKGLFPTGLSWTIPSVGDTIDDATGVLTGTAPLTGGGSVTATGGAGSYAAGVGCRVRWLTPDVKNGNRVSGATFFTHWLSGNYDASGTIANAPLATLQAAASAFATSGSPWGVWSRPVNGAGGSFHAISAAVTPDKVSWLRTRKV